MIKSDEIKELALALSKAQGVMSPAIKDAENPFFKNKYADLASCWEAARKALAANGLSVVQMPGWDGERERVTCETLLLHSSGQCISSTMSMVPVKKDPQSIGSCLTYLRRYGFSACVGICQDDDDGNEASSRKQETKASKSKPEPGGSGSSGASGQWQASATEPPRGKQGDYAAEAASMIKGSGGNPFLCWLDTAKKGKEFLGEEQYRVILKAHGVEKANMAGAPRLFALIEADLIIAIATKIKKEKEAN